MALVETIRLWSEGVAAGDKGDWRGALKSFTAITDPKAKICFNIGCCHLVTGNLQAAEKAFTSTVEKDNHLAVGYFQRGSVFFKEGKYKEALQDWVRCYTELRGNQLIDYKILGLTFKLYSCEVLYNVALGHVKVDNWAKAEETLILALSQKAEPRHGTKIEKAMQEILKQKDFPLTEMPKGRLFYPSEKLVEQLEKKDYLGKATVVASVVDKDNFSGFAPLQPQSDDPPLRPKTPEILRTLQGEPHRVLFEFTPETIEEMEVMPGNIVFVLKKGTDNWATVLFNGKKGIVPCNYLEPVELKFQSQIQATEINQEEQSVNDGTKEAKIPAPPTHSAPSIPRNHQDKQATSSNREKSSSDEKAITAAPSYHVKVYYKYTVAMQVSHKLSYGDLLILISSKLKLTPCSIKLSFKDGESDVPLTTENVEIAWELSTDNCLKLKCTDVHAEVPLVNIENPENPVGPEKPARMNVIALFNYEASQPEDLPFKKGDVIKVVNKVSEEWWEGECHDKFGIFPSTFVDSL